MTRYHVTLWASGRCVRKFAKLASAIKCRRELWKELGGVSIEINRYVDGKWAGRYEEPASLPVL